jgi:uncharacterized protein (DUF1330 family)
LAAYVIADINVLNRTSYDAYRQNTAVTLAAYGGKFLVRGGNADVIEGDWQPNRLVMIEFEDASKAREWLNSPAYNVLKPIRQSAARTNMILVEGGS